MPRMGGTGMLINLQCGRLEELIPAEVRVRTRENYVGKLRPEHKSVSTLG